jgi:hypothetical protein
MLSRKKRWAKRRGRIGGRSRLAPSRFVTPHATARSTEVPARKSLYTLSEALHGVVSVIVPKMDSCKTAVSARETQGGLGWASRRIGSKIHQKPHEYMATSYPIIEYSGREPE